MKVSIEFDPSKMADRKILNYILSIADEEQAEPVEQIGSECVCSPEATTKRKGGRPSNAEKARRRQEEETAPTPATTTETSATVEATVSGTVAAVETPVVQPNVTGLFDALRTVQASAAVSAPETILPPGVFPPGVFAPKIDTQVASPHPTTIAADTIAMQPTPTAIPYVPHVHIDNPTGIIPLELFREAMQQANNRAPGKPFVLLKSSTWPDGTPKKMWFNAESVDPDLREKVMEIWALS